MPDPKPPRVYAPDLVEGRPTRLPPEEIGHLTRVLRRGAGDLVRIFDGRGVEWLARLERRSGGDLEAQPLDRVTPAPEPAIEVTVAQALLTRDKMSVVVRDVAMLGASALQPLSSLHSQTRPGPAAGRALAERWHRVAIASVKQCGRAVVPAVYVPQPLDRCLRADAAAMRVMLVEPGAVPDPRPVRELAREPRPKRVTLFVGPEGGWARDEIADAVAAGALAVSLGARTLRAETVPIVALTAVLLIWDDPL